MADGTYGAMMYPVASSKAEIAKAARVVANDAYDMMAWGEQPSAESTAYNAVHRAFSRFADELERPSDDD